MRLVCGWPGAGGAVSLLVMYCDVVGLLQAHAHVCTHACTGTLFCSDQRHPPCTRRSCLLLHLRDELEEIGEALADQELLMPPGSEQWLAGQRHELRNEVSQSPGLTQSIQDG